MRFGLRLEDVSAALPDWLNTRRKTSARLAEDLRKQLEIINVRLRYGHAQFVEPNRLRLSDPYGQNSDLTADNVILATGSRPVFSSNKSANLLNSDDLLRHNEVPRHLLIIGAGYIGCEFASIYRTLGSEVTLIEKEGRVLFQWDEAAGAKVAHGLKANGVRILLNEEVDISSLAAGPGRGVVVPTSVGILPVNLVLVATGRQPNAEELGLETFGIKAPWFVDVNERMRTSQHAVFAVGDINGISLLDSTAVWQARIAVEAILGSHARFDLRWIPRCVHTEPQVASVGWTEHEAMEAGLDVVVASESGRFISEEESTVVDPEPTTVKLLAKSKSDRILGCLAIGPQAGEIVNLVSSSLQLDGTFSNLDRIDFLHPSAAETLQRCASRLV
jgi:pyruvate/2-oxoglutarate dehydrogenase complex dihydrolipoamide dehydrogenase (E3) component